MVIQKEKIKIAGYKGKIVTRLKNELLIIHLHHIFHTRFIGLTKITDRLDRPVMSFSHQKDCFFLKRYITKGPRAFLKRVFRIDCASLSFNLPCHLNTLGINTPSSVALLRKSVHLFHYEDIFIMEGVKNAVSLRSFVQDHIYSGKMPLEAKRCFFKSFAEFLANIHNAGVYHGDFTSRNILVALSPVKGYRFYLIDLDAIRSIGWISRRRRIKNLDEIGRNFMDLSKISFYDRARIVAFYLRHYGKEKLAFKAFFRKVQKRTSSKVPQTVIT